MHVAFADASWRDANQLGLTLQLGDCAAAAVAHTGPHASHELVDDGLRAPFVRDAPLDAFGVQFARGASTFYGGDPPPTNIRIIDNIVVPGVNGWIAHFNKNGAGNVATGNHTPDGTPLLP